MKKTLFLFFISFIFCGCVSQAKHREALFHLEQSRLSQDRLRQENAKMAAEIERLEEKNEYINKLVADYAERAASLDKYMRSSKNGKNKALAELAADKQELSDKIHRQETEIKGLMDQNRKLSEILEDGFW